MNELLLRRRGLMMAGKKSRLPSEYQEVEYLESTGTQWIDTSYKPNSNTKVTAGMNFTDIPQNSALFGTRTMYNSMDFYSLVQVYSEGRIRTDYYNNTAYSIERTTDYLEIDKDKAVTTINGITAQNRYGAFSSAYNLLIFAMNDGGNPAWISFARAKYVNIYDNVAVREYIMCYRKSDHKPGMYDLVTKTFFTNSGTGEFIVGADVN